MNTELYELDKAERLERLKGMPTERLLAELDDTVQFDMMELSTEEWLNCSTKKVFQSILSELSNRLGIGYKNFD